MIDSVEEIESVGVLGSVEDLGQLWAHHKVVASVVEVSLTAILPPLALLPSLLILPRLATLSALAVVVDSFSPR